MSPPRTHRSPPSTVLAVACAAGVLVLAVVASAFGMAGVVDSLATEADECGLLLALCRMARTSIGRAEGTLAGADLLSTRQALSADARVREAIDTAEAIEHKRGRRLACFDDEVCAGIVPRPRPAPRPKRAGG